MTDEEFSALWNRACEWDAPAVRTHRGDGALHAVLTFHGSVQNGGLLDAVENYGEDGEYPMTRVLAAYRYLGLHDVASLLEAARREYVDLTAAGDERLGDAEERLNGTYTLDYDTIEAAVRATLQAHPEDFAPLR